jgi:hypothetical protein
MAAVVVMVAAVAVMVALVVMVAVAVMAVVVSIGLVVRVWLAVLIGAGYKRAVFANTFCGNSKRHPGLCRIWRQEFPCKGRVTHA